ncbi:general stress protein [Aneurinibacillus sp. BA2021]|nr:general stress protein [Aneurinibacillus sp. BA2021]
MKEKIAGVFRTETEAIAALHALQQLGCKPDDISLISKDKNEQAQIKTQHKNNMERGLMLGSVSGGVFGGVAGWVASLAAPMMSRSPHRIKSKINSQGASLAI